ncbi:ABC transporter [Daphnia sinensis]|uniref:ABC transporter n=1 Tax=Daphnia sinensis TaxID=1820382 RepID=A0AAD5KDH2_9CRUS|nr:ABC transporter [Daphnia sinensis]
MVNPSMDREELHANNASDIYQSLSELKGSALKKYFQKTPEQLFDTFTRTAVNAASIGQVHKASQNGKNLAVKIQYPGVADSVSSDLKLVRPFALRLLNMNERSWIITWGSGRKIIGRNRLYSRSAALTSERIITMDWLDGKHIKEWMETNPSQEAKNKIGQALWDFYHHQVHHLKQVHADPHPGNFIVQEGDKLGIIDFGCVKVIPEDFYLGYFSLIKKELLIDENELNQIFYDLEFISDKDTEVEKVYFNVFKEMISLLGKPFHVDRFDFADDKFFDRFSNLGTGFPMTKCLENQDKLEVPDMDFMSTGPILVFITCSIS